MDKQALIDAIGRSGGKQNALDEADDFWGKLDCLQQSGRYGRLLSQLAEANDKSNFLALALEANFAYQFESRGLELAYEVKQDAQQKSSIDFLLTTPRGDSVYLELRLLQQEQSISGSIKAQLENCGAYRVVMDTIHGVLFLFRQPDTGILAYQLEQYLMWNRVLVDRARESAISAEVTSAIPVRPFQW